ncbi:hypothetical protein JJV70_16895 [Streptomyces sp. JJ66]|uniref:hypothetical protein n=1 Tax=Streptomyces sp. JJ66 TaxID=2803843 RepID=UPI001C563CF6|nr:hypothetical protein [Streptomyces sp. JJ66]MBW1603755.1 hypothetical protein [Streptomyces sp. JJ66]
MGNESEKLVFDYLSRVGDLAHRTTLTAAERARLVGELRAGIERLRAEGSAESAAEVRRVLNRFGRPEDVVAAADTGGGVPQPRPAEPSASGRGVRGRRPAPPPAPPTPPGPTPPHLVGLDELPPEAADPRWWEGDGPSPTVQASGGHVEGFVGGIEIPEMLVPPTGDGETPTLVPEQVARGGPEQGAHGAAEPSAPAVEAAGAAAAAPAGRFARWRRGLLAGAATSAGTASGVARAGGPVELVAALALLAGAVLGSLPALAVGWLLAWWSPRLPVTERKWAVLGMPGLVGGAVLVWLWGRAGGRWGEPIASGGLREVLDGTYPWAVRAAAVASGAFLLWRARRPAGG